MDTGSFIVHVKIEYICKDITEGVKARLDISNFKLVTPLPKGLIKHELSGKIIKELVRLRAKTYS